MPSPITNSIPTFSQVLADFQIGEEFFWEPIRLARPGAWSGHLATAFWLTKALKPQIFVELGTHSGNSYSAFCQAIASIGLPARAFAVDTWKGDKHAGYYDESIYTELSSFNESHFAEFSKLLRTTFDDACAYFEDRSIDLLHIDGLHSYEAVKHDFDTWTNKLSDRAVVLFHDTNVRDRGFGVWKLWLELADTYPSFEFHHSEGLGVLGVGPNQPEALQRFFELGHDPESAAVVRRIFSTRGELYRSRSQVLDLREHTAYLEANLRNSEANFKNLDSGFRQQIGSLETALLERSQEFVASEESIRLLQQQNEESVRLLQQQVADRDSALGERQKDIRAKAELINNLQRELMVQGYTLRSREDELQRATLAIQHNSRLIKELEPAANSVVLLREKLIEATKNLEAERSKTNQISQELSSTRRRLGSVESGTAWKLTSRIQSSLQRYPNFRRRAKQTMRLVWWTATFQLFGRLRDRRQLFQQRNMIAKSALFDASWYLSRNPDVAESGCDPVLHYILYGANERRNPGPQFDSAAYLRRYPDVLQAGLNPLLHYLAYGADEGRQINSVESPLDKPRR
jgi:hypothetical protein